MTTSTERMRRLRARQGKPGRAAQPGQLDPKPHGTVAAYRRHLRHRDTEGDPCGPCTEANTASMAAYRAAKKSLEMAIDAQLARQAHER